MTSIIRFVFTLVIVGMVVSLAVILVANARSQRRDRQQYERDTARFAAMVADINGRVRRADIIVESQRLDGRDKPLESTLLIRQYRAVGTSQTDPLPVVRITIPGNLLRATGLLLEFDQRFAPNRADFAALRKAQIALFARFCGADEKPASQSGASDSLFTFLSRSQVPELLRLDPLAAQPSPFETGLWQYLWNAIPEPPPGSALPWVASQPDPGIKITWLKPAAIALRRTHTYSAYVSTEGITLGQDEPGIPDLMDAMEAQGKKLPPA